MDSKSYLWHIMLSAIINRQIVTKKTTYNLRNGCIYFKGRKVLLRRIIPPKRIKGSKVGAVVRELAFHQCVPGSIPGLGFTVSPNYSAALVFS